VIIRQDADGWRIVHYQVSRLDWDLPWTRANQVNTALLGFLRSW